MAVRAAARHLSLLALGGCGARNYNDIGLLLLRIYTPLTALVFRRLRDGGRLAIAIQIWRDRCLHEILRNVYRLYTLLVEVSLQISTAHILNHLILS